jgi:hypothetical protein
LDRESIYNEEQFRLLRIQVYFLPVVGMLNVLLVVFGGPHFGKLHTEFKQFVFDFVRETAAQIV